MARAAVVGLGVVCYAAIFGCSEGPAPQPKHEAEASFAAQLADVRAGRSDRIVVTDVAVNAAELAALHEVPQLVHLEIPKTSVDDRDIETLRNTKGLQVLVLGETRLTNAGLIAIAELRELGRLNVPRVNAGAEGLAAVAALPNLQLLRIGGPNITDESMKQLSAATSLRSLIVKHSPITDAGLAPFAEMKNLESLYLDGTNVTEQGARFLEERRPDLHVHFP